MWPFTVEFMSAGAVFRCLWLVYKEPFSARVDVEQCSKCVRGRREAFKKTKRKEKK